MSGIEYIYIFKNAAFDTHIPSMGPMIGHLNWNLCIYGPVPVL